MQMYTFNRIAKSATICQMDAAQFYLLPLPKLLCLEHCSRKPYLVSPTLFSRRSTDYAFNPSPIGGCPIKLHVGALLAQQPIMAPLMWSPAPVLPGRPTSNNPIMRQKFTPPHVCV